MGFHRFEDLGALWSDVGKSPYKNVVPELNRIMQLLLKHK